LDLRAGALNWSGNELRAQVTKAGRGLGYDWGRAKYLGESVLRAEQNGLSALTSFLQLTDTLDTGPSRLLHSNLLKGDIATVDVVDLGIALIDHLSRLDFQTPVAFEVVGFSLFLGTLCYGLTGTDRALQIEIDDIECVVQADRIVVGPEPPFQGVCRLRFCPRRFDDWRLVRRFEVTHANAEILDHLASRVYAPATEASRLAGAGAGLNDND
jgi:hypothetical protein